MQDDERSYPANDPGGMTTVSVRPRLVWGPSDSSALPMFRSVEPVRSIVRGRQEQPGSTSARPGLVRW